MMQLVKILCEIWMLFRADCRNIIPVSVAIFVCWIIQYFCFRDALHYVQLRRFCINPNDGFAQQLTVGTKCMANTSMFRANVVAENASLFFAFFASDIFLQGTVVDRLSTISITMDTFFQCNLAALYSKLQFLLALQYLIYFILTRLQHTKMKHTSS